MEFLRFVVLVSKAGVREYPTISLTCYTVVTHVTLWIGLTLSKIPFSFLIFFCCSNMADTLANLEAVINKWSDRGPYSAGDGPRNPVAQKNLQDYNKVIERGKGWWKEKFTSVGPPPVRSEKYGRQRRPRTDIPRYTQVSLYPLLPYMGLIHG